jgi:hypothetical protein
MYLKEAEIYSLYDYLKKREGEFLEKQKQIRQETLAIANTDKEAERAYYQREIERLEFYHNQKVILYLRKKRIKFIFVFY